MLREERKVRVIGVARITRETMSRRRVFSARLVDDKGEGVVGQRSGS